MASNRNRRDRSRRNPPGVRSTVTDNLGSDGEYDEDDDDMCDSPIDWFEESKFDERLLDPQFFVKFITNTDEKPKKQSDSHQLRHSIAPRHFLSTGTSSSTEYGMSSTDNTDSTDNTASSSASNTNTAINISSYESESSQNSPENTDESGPQCSTIFTSSQSNSANNASNNSGSITTSRSESSHGTIASESSSLGLTNDEMVALGLLGVTPESGTMPSNSGDTNSSLDALAGLFNGLNTSDSMASNDNNQSESSDSDIVN